MTRSILAALGLLATVVNSQASPDITVCQGCHADGGPVGIPRLGAMPAVYVTNQLFMFREGQRTASPMNDLTEAMTDTDLQDYANAIAAMPAPAYSGPPGQADQIARADAAIQKHRCASCHGASLEGGGGVPRLRGQDETYLAQTLAAYKTSARAGFDPQMNEVAGELSAAEMADLAYALARR